MLPQPLLQVESYRASHSAPMPPRPALRIWSSSKHRHARPVLIAALCFGLVPTAGFAHADTADEQRFVRDIRATGTVVPGITDAQIVSAGWWTCDQLTNWPTSEVINQLVSIGLTPGMARNSVMLSVKDLCPHAGW